MNVKFENSNSYFNALMTLTVENNILLNTIMKVLPDVSKEITIDSLISIASETREEVLTGLSIRFGEGNDWKQFL